MLDQQTDYGTATNDTLYGVGHNNPPADPLDAAIAPFADSMAEAENWLDGKSKVETKGQHDAVDLILKDIRKAGTAVGKAEKAYVGPRHKDWQDAKAKFAPTLADLKDQKTGLAKLVSDFKIKLAAEKAEAQRLANIAAKKLADEAKAKVAAADADNIEEIREAKIAVMIAKDAKKDASAANKDTVTGLRTVHEYEIEDYSKVINDIRMNDRDALVAFMDEYVRRNRKARRIEGVRTWESKAAY